MSSSRSRSSLSTSADVNFPTRRAKKSLRFAGSDGTTYRTRPRHVRVASAASRYGGQVGAVGKWVGGREREM
eukprot:60979-Rhodomonas_salina.2